MPLLLSAWDEGGRRLLVLLPLTDILSEFAEKEVAAPPGEGGAAEYIAA